MDFRSDKSESFEGKGRARDRWEAYVSRTRVGSAVLSTWDTFNMGSDPNWFESQVGFWVVWHMYGGFEGLEARGMHRSTIWRKVAKFRRTWGAHPDEFVMPGVEIEPEEFWTARLNELLSKKNDKANHKSTTKKAS